MGKSGGMLSFQDKASRRSPLPMLNDTINALSAVVKDVPVGTNLGIVQVLWALLSGALLTSRGGLIPALASSGLDARATRRAWAAFRYGQWQIRTLLEAWGVYVHGLVG